jgi:hypothetical protein
MVRPRVKFSNVGRMQTIFTVNFEEPDSILAIILPLMQNIRLKSKVIKLAFGVIDNIDDTIEGGIEQVTKLLQSLSPTSQNPVDVKFMLQTFGSFLFNLPKDQQLTIYKMLGNQLNKSLKEQSEDAPKMENVDLSQLLESSGSDLYDQADPRLKVFIEEAVKTDYTEKYGSDVANNKKTVFCYNIVENFLKARNLRFVSLAGLSFLTLVYIFSGRSVQTCKLVAATGAKGNHNIVTQFVLPNSTESSYKSCVDGVTVYYSFDNIQKISKIWRVYGSHQDKSLAKVATSIVHCYPDGLLNSDIQYLLRHSPMLWLYRLELNHNSNVLQDTLDKNIIEKMMKLNEDDLDVVLGRWDLTVQMAIEDIKKENIDGKDAVDKIIDKRKKIEESKVKYCKNGHRNEKPRGNQIFCRSCKEELIEVDEIHEDCDEDMAENSQYTTGKFKKIKIMENEAGPIEASLVNDDGSKKAKLFPRVRNTFNENEPVYESEGAVFVNPNTFIRVKIVLEEILKLTKTDVKHTTLIQIEEDGSVTVKVAELHNIRTWVVVTLDGLPHKIAIDVIKHCYKCETCGKELTVNSDVGKHVKNTGHRLYWKKFGNIILKIGGLHAEMNMLRSFVSLTWDIFYSFLCRSIGFKSPKAQLLQQKVQDMHKSWDTFNTVREAVVKEIVKLFVDFATEKQLDANAENFEIWANTEVKNPDIKLMIEIQKYFGTSLWLYRAGQRANYFKLCRAGMKVFSGLFHINGNLHYSAIEVFDDYLMTSLENKNQELFNHLITRLCTNLKSEPFTAQSHDARHEESNKLAQNMFQGKDLEELRMAFTIVDDVYKLRKKVFTECSINDRSDEASVVVPNYEKCATIMRSDLRTAGYFDKPYEKKTLKSIDGQNLHEDLTDLFKISQERRQVDVLNAFRYSDFTMAYNPKSKIHTLDDGKTKKRSEKDIQEEILILIHILEDDPDTEIVMREAFEKVKNYDMDTLENFLDLLVSKEYQSIYDKYK